MDAAKRKNDFAFGYLPKVDRNYAWTELWITLSGRSKAYSLLAMNAWQLAKFAEEHRCAEKSRLLVVGEIMRRKQRVLEISGQTP